MIGCGCLKIFAAQPELSSTICAYGQQYFSAKNHGSRYNPADGAK
jgi:hypothetical protein